MIECCPLVPTSANAELVFCVWVPAERRQTYTHMICNTMKRKGRCIVLEERRKRNVNTRVCLAKDRALTKEKSAKPATGIFWVPQKYILIANNTYWRILVITSVHVFQGEWFILLIKYKWNKNTRVNEVGWTNNRA